METGKVLKVIFVVIGFLFCAKAALRFTNVDCTTVDKKFCDFEYCYIRSYNRTFRYLSLKVKLFQVPVTNVTVRFSLLKRANGYKPFLYNVSFDACAYFKNKKRNPVVTYFFECFRKYSNMNHSCPYSHDVVLEKVQASYVDYKMTSVLPMPHGEYCMHMDWLAYGVLRASVRAYWELN